MYVHNTYKLTYIYKTFLFIRIYANLSRNIDVKFAKKLNKTKKLTYVGILQIKLPKKDKNKHHQVFRADD